ncbi:MAG: ABC transporter permease [Propionibacteriales bacterium]|nr:ABC transporter permease [Propionibacteriales bacterium]
MSTFISYTLEGLFTGAAYAIAASGLVLTYSTTRVFNIAHGAVGMVFGFLYWDFSVKQGLPVWFSLILVLLVVAPLLGVFFQRVLTRGLGSAPIGVSLVVTVGMLVALIGVAQQIWSTEDARVLPEFFVGKSISIGDDINLSYHRAITIVLSGIVAAGLYVLLTRTRVGTAMRASVDNPDLLELYGGKPKTVAALSWAVGTSLGALSGILLAPIVGLEYFGLTLLVISAYAAAMLGKLTSLPLTYVGALLLGLASSYLVGYLQYLPGDKYLTGLPAVVPALFLALILVLLPQAPLRIGQVKGLVAAPVPSLTKSLGWGAGLLVVVFVASSGMSNANLLLVGTAATYGIVMLSLVLLTGYGGVVSLAQFTFAGVGAIAYCKIDQPNLFGLLLVVLISAGVGALVAFPVLRLTGLYLALATLAFAQLMEKLIFVQPFAFEFANLLQAKRLSILGYQFNTNRQYVVMMAVFFVLVAVLVLALRRGPLGRILIAMRDSQAACGTLGLDQRWFRVALFAGSAGIAGLGGALFAGLRQAVGSADFIYFQSLLLLLFAVIWGVTSVTGALLGGVFMMYLPEAQATYPDVAGLLFVLIGIGAVVIGRDPNGLANKLFGFPRWIQTTVYPFLAGRYPGLALKSREPRAAEDEDEPIAPGPVETNQEVDSDAVAAR